MRHFLTLKDFTKEEILEIIDLGLVIKRDLKEGIHKDYMSKKTLAMIFEKSSTRTRVSFETGIYLELLHPAHHQSRNHRQASGQKGLFLSAKSFFVHYQQSQLLNHCLEQ